MFDVSKLQDNQRAICKVCGADMTDYLKQGITICPLCGVELTDENISIETIGE